MQIQILDVREQLKKVGDHSVVEWRGGGPLVLAEIAEPAFEMETGDFLAYAGVGPEEGEGVIERCDTVEEHPFTKKVCEGNRTHVAARQRARADSRSPYEAAGNIVDDHSEQLRRQVA